MSPLAKGTRPSDTHNVSVSILGLISLPILVGTQLNIPQHYIKSAPCINSQYQHQHGYDKRMCRGTFMIKGKNLIMTERYECIVQARGY